MKILEFMSFNPGWFLTAPGILITAGVILLLIALILLLASGKKEEDKVEEGSVAANPVVAPQQPQIVEPVQVAVPQAPVTSVQPEVTTVNMETPVSNAVPAVEEIKVEQPVSVESVLQPAVESVEPVASIPVIEPVQEIKAEPKIEIFEPTVPTVNMETPVSNIMPTIEEVKVEQPEVKPAVSIYGGVSPTTDIFKQPEQPKVIYGGADPLENTAPIPKVDATPVNSLFGNATPIMEPKTQEIPVTQTAVMDNSVTETISAAPTAPVEPVAPVMPAAPEVVPTSSIFESTATPVIETPVVQKEEIETLDF